MDMLSIVDITCAAKTQENSTQHTDNNWHISVAQLPASTTVKVRSEASPCGDIVDVTLFSRTPTASITLLA